jgi:K+/H+ antiporter YhaU regulatory subunit KhtT
LLDLAIRVRTGCTVVAIERRGALTTPPSATAGLEPGDRLMVLGSAEAIERLKRILADDPAVPEAGT